MFSILNIGLFYNLGFLSILFVCGYEINTLFIYRLQSHIGQAKIHQSRRMGQLK